MLSGYLPRAPSVVRVRPGHVPLSALEINCIARTRVLRLSLPTLTKQVDTYCASRRRKTMDVDGDEMLAKDGDGDVAM